MTTYTIDDHGEITSGLTAVEAADVLLTDDGYEYEIRQDSEGDWRLYVSPYSRASTLGGKPMVAAAEMWSFAADEAAATAEIMERVIRSGRWTKGELNCRTDEAHAAMMAELAADQAGEEAWYALRAYNSQTVYGFGTAEQADRYSDVLTDGREVNVYAARLMTADEIAERPNIEDEGVNLDDELAARDGLR